MSTMADSQPSDKTSRIFLWMLPRNLSTVFEKCIAHMEGAEVWHEPYATAYYRGMLANPATYERFPGMRKYFGPRERAAEKFEYMERYQGGNLESSEKFTYEYVKQQLEKPLDEGKSFMFVKDGSRAIDGHYEYLPEVPFKHTFLIRHPNRSALSLRKALAHSVEYEGDIDEFDLGPGRNLSIASDKSTNPQYELWKYVREHLEPSPVVIDADDLQNHTGDILKKYCMAVGIPWKDEYVSWDASDAFLKSLHGSMELVAAGSNGGLFDKAFRSSEIKPCSGSVPTIPACCEVWASWLMEGYKAMYEHRLKPDAE